MALSRRSPVPKHGGSIRRVALPILGAVLLALLFASPTQALRPQLPIHAPCFVPLEQFRDFSKQVWREDRWRRGDPKHVTVVAYRRMLACAGGPGHREQLRRIWRRDQRAYFRARREVLRRDINRRWAPHWAPDYGGPKLPPYVIASLAETAGEVLGVNVPGWTMAQMTIGESGRRPGSAGVDAGGTVGYGLWAITSPFANSILAKHGWSYEDMWNPVKNAVVMTEIYAAQGLGAWYGDGFVTSSNAHYTGRFDLTTVLGGLSFRRSLRLK